MTINYHSIPDYVRTEADRVASKAERRQEKNNRPFTFAAVSDFHYPINEETKASALHTFQAIRLIREKVRLDAAVFFGDYLVGGPDSTKKQSFTDAAEICGMIDFAIGDVPQIRLNGNHDILPYNNDGIMSAEERYSFIGRFNKNAVTDSENAAANYGYRDFPEHRLRLIYLNTSDIDYECHNAGDRMKYYISERQFKFIIKALDLTCKPDAGRWASVILTHFPVDWPVLERRGENGEKYDAEPPQLPILLDDYIRGRSGSIAVKSGILKYDFTGKNTAPVIAAFNGHTHCFNVGRISGSGIPRITIPNVSFGRENEYGQNGHLRFGEIETYRKELGFKDTSFNIIEIDRAAGYNADSIIQCINYGAGYDRAVKLKQHKNKVVL